MAHDVFISYATEDRQIAEAMCKSLEENRISCWYAPRDVPFGVDYEEAIVDAISDCRLVVLILSSHSNNSLHVRREIQNACAEETATPILPVRIEDVPLNKALRYYLSSAQWLDASTPPLEKHLQRLVEQLRLRLPQSAVINDTPAAGPGSKAEQAHSVSGQAAADASALAKGMVKAKDATEFARPEHQERDVRGELRKTGKVRNVGRLALLRLLWQSSAVKALVVVFASYLLLMAGIDLLDNRFPKHSTFSHIITAVVVFLLVEGFGSYVYLKRSQRVRWWLFVGLLVVAMTGLLVGLGAYSQANFERETRLETIDPGVEKSPTTRASGVVMSDSDILSGVEVKLLQSPFTNPVGTSITDPSGEYHFRNLTRDNVYNLVVEPSSNYDGTTVMLVASRENNQANIELRGKQH